MNSLHGENPDSVESGVPDTPLQWLIWDDTLRQYIKPRFSRARRAASCNYLYKWLTGFNRFQEFYQDIFYVFWPRKKYNYCIHDMNQHSHTTFFREKLIS